MAPVPVVCDTCGTFFFAQNIIGGSGAARVEFKDVSYGPCPICGETGRVLDGVYELVDDTVRLLAASQHTRDQLQRLRNFLVHAQQGNATPQQVAEVVEREAPALRGAVGQLVVPKDPSAFYAMVAVLLSIVTIVLAQIDQEGVSEEDVEKITRGVVEEVERKHPRPPSSVPSSHVKRPPQAPRKIQAQRKKKRRRR